MKTWKLSVFLSCFLSVFPQQRVIRLVCCHGYCSQLAAVVLCGKCS